MWPGPYGEWGSRKYLLASLDQSLGRMGLDYVDIFYSHRFDPRRRSRRRWRARYRRASGRALYAASRTTPPSRRWKPRGFLKALGTPLLIHQPRYNMVDRWIENGPARRARRPRRRAICFSPLEQGILTDRYLGGIPEGSRASVGHFLRPSDSTRT